MQEPTFADLTEKGLNNVLEILTEYAGVAATSKFIDDNFGKFAENFETLAELSKQDDVDNPFEYTFAGEANTGGVFDTCCREKIINTLSQILIAKDWPCFGDSKEHRQQFVTEFYHKVSETDGVSIA